MLETVLGGVIVAILTGYTIAAFKYPHSYKILYKLFLKIGLILPIGLIAFNLGALDSSTTYLKKMLSEKPQSQILEYQNTILEGTASLKSIELFTLITLGFILYSQILLILPEKIGFHKKTKPQPTNNTVYTL